MTDERKVGPAAQPQQVQVDQVETIAACEGTDSTGKKVFVLVLNGKHYALNMQGVDFLIATTGEYKKKMQKPSLVLLPNE